MTETSPVVEPKAAPANGGCRKAAVASYLTGPLRGYFALAEQAPLPARLSVLIGQFEAAFAVSGDRLADSFRADLIQGLPMLRTFAMSLCANEARADDLVEEMLVRAWANRTRFTPGSNFTAWTFTILRNQFYSGIRKARREVGDGGGAHAATLLAAPDQEHAVTLGSVMNLIGTLPLQRGLDRCSERRHKLGCVSHRRDEAEYQFNPCLTLPGELPNQDPRRLSHGNLVSGGQIEGDAECRGLSDHQVGEASVGQSAASLRRRGGLRESAQSASRRGH